MIRVLLFAVLLAGSATADPVRFVEETEIEGVRVRIPMEVSMTAVSETDLRIKITGDLGRIQDVLPAILSRHIENECDKRTSIAVTDVSAEETRIKLVGQLQAYRWLCTDGERGAEMLRQTARVETVLGGQIEDGCLVMRVVSTDLQPDGLTGALMNLTGFTGRLNGDLETRLDAALRDDDNCIGMPDEFQAFDARITGGGFRDIGGGRIGAEIDGQMDISAQNFIRLVHLLGRQGKLGD